MYKLFNIAAVGSQSLHSTQVAMVTMGINEKAVNFGC